MATRSGVVKTTGPVGSDNTLDTFPSHVSTLGVGGIIEKKTIAERNAIPVDAGGSLNSFDDEGLSSGKRRLYMYVYVADTEKTYQLYVSYTTWTGYTDAQKVNALSDNNNWVEAKFGGGNVNFIDAPSSSTDNLKVSGETITYDNEIVYKAISSSGNSLYEYTYFGDGNNHLWGRIRMEQF